MGTTFIHTHVRVDDVDAVAAAVSEIARLRGFRVAVDGEPCDHDVVVAAARGWTSIYRRFDDISVDLSAALETDVVYLSIFDSDVLDVSFYCEGALADVYSSEPGKKKGQPRRWDRLCVPPATWRDVKRIFVEAKTEPEKALSALGRAIGIEERSLYPDELPAAARRLRFRNPPAARRRIVQGPPALTGISDIDSPGIVLSIAAGQQEYYLNAQSAGGHASGMSIEVGGAGVRDGLVTLAGLRYRNAPRAIETRQLPDGPWIVSEQHDSGLAAAAGYVDENDIVRVVDNHPSVQLVLSLVPLTTGSSELVVRWSPLAPTAETYVQRIALRVD